MKMRKSSWFKLSIASWLLLAVSTVSMSNDVWAADANVATANVAVDDKAKSEERKTTAITPISIGDEKNSADEIYKKGVGLPSEDLHLVNQGRFVELADKLSKQVDTGVFNRKAAWLAFTYLYLQKCDELKKLSDPIPTQSAQTPLTINSALVQVFFLMCDKKLNEAERLLQCMPAPAMNDAFVNYAFATLAGKQGKPQVSIAYTKRAVDIAPDFAWGYRTIAFLQEKWLNQNSEAAKNYAKALEIEPKLADSSMSLINLYLAVNNYDQAIAVARNAIRHDDKTSANYYVLADIYLRQWRLQEAAQILRKAIAIDRSNSEYRRLLALILQTQGNKEEALEEEKLAVSYSKSKSSDLVDLATMQLNAGKQDDAVLSLKESLDLDANNMKAASELTNLLVQMKRFDELAETLNKCAAKLPKNEAIRLHLGDALSAAGKTDRATEAYKAAANLNPNDAEPHTRIAAMLISKKDYEGAAKEYTRSLNINSNSVANLVALGGCEAEMDDYLKAEAAFVTALALHQLTQPVDSVVPPTRTQIIRGLAALLFREGRYADAASQFVSLCEMDKDPATKNLNKFMYAQAVALRDLSKDSFKQLEGAYHDLSNDEKDSQKINYVDTLLRGNYFDQSLSLLNEMSGSAIKDSLFYNICLSRAYAGKGNLAEAEAKAKGAIAICDKENSPHSDAFCQLGEILFAKNDLDGAEKNVNAALGVNTKAFRAYVLLGNIAMQRKEIKTAVEAANKAIEINPYLIDAYILLGNAQTVQGDLKGALTTFHKAVDLYPGLLQTHQSLLAVLQKLGTKEEISREQAAIAGLKSKE